jgi:hypothetical protein
MRARYRVGAAPTQNLCKLSAAPCWPQTLAGSCRAVLPGDRRLRPQENHAIDQPLAPASDPFSTPRRHARSYAGR